MEKEFDYFSSIPIQILNNNKSSLMNVKDCGVKQDLKITLML